MKYHVRREDREITDNKELDRIMEKVQYVTLAMTKDGHPYAVNLNCGYDKEHKQVNFHSASKVVS